MTIWNAYFAGLGALCAAGFFVWLLSLVKRDVSIVDSLWSVFFVVAALVYFLALTQASPRAVLVLILVSLWALRLFAYITWRNWGDEEDRRYQAMREKRGKAFAWQSLYVVFLLQAAIAWLVSLPLLGAIHGTAPLGALDALGVLVFGVGLFFEAVGDWQLARFKANPDNKGKVMDRGLWRYTRHPNYFGDFALWWGFYLIAVGAGAWWSFPGPLLMSFFLLKVSGVALLEKDIGERRPKYADYIRRTNAFFPGPPKPA
jgi:steroid 5-alpha reductase family enzyme